MKALINASTYDFINFYENRYILFDTEIQDTGDMKDFKGAEEIIDCSGCIVLPGLVNCHTHVYSELSRGMPVYFNPRNFKDILEQLWWKLDSRLDEAAVYHSGLMYGCESIKNGVTTIIDHHASGLYIFGSLDMLKKSICEKLGLRGIFCFEASDRFDLKECIEENIDFSKTRTEYCSGLFGMHASMSLSESSLEAIGNNLGSLPIHIHVAESRDDLEDCAGRYGETIVERLDRHHLLNEKSILAHCVHITEEEAALISKRKCFVALNPTSNMNNAVGVADYGLFRKHGIKCIIGNDGLGANITRDYLNLAFSMKNRLGSPTSFNMEDLLNIIRNGYEYVSTILNVRLGRIERGYKADLVAVPYDAPTPMDEGNIMYHLFYGIFDNFHPRELWVSGKQLLKGYCLTFDNKEMLSRSREEAAKVWNRVNNS
jgi:cytosine/adenosine deaminase-related metal-dependent hydrolase